MLLTNSATNMFDTVSALGKGCSFIFNAPVNLVRIKWIMCDFIINIIIIIIIYYKIFELITIKENYQYKNITKFIG